jgi:phage portal protein BeeE
MPSLMERLRGLWKGQGPRGVGVFSLGGREAYGTFFSQSWDYARIASSVYGNPTGYRCIEAIVSNFSRPAWMLLPEGSTWPQPSEVQAVKKHPLLDVLNRPNASTSGTMFQRFIARDLEMSGRNFWLKMQGADGYGFKGPVTGLRRLPPQRMIVVGNADDELLGFIYTDRNGRQTPILPNALVYLRYPHPERTYDGMAPALVAGLAAETDTTSSRFNRELLANDGALPGYLILKGLTPQQFQEWKQEWEAGAQPGKTRFLAAESAEYAKVGQTNQELTYNELRHDSQDDIMRAIGVPRAVAFDVSHETYANADREQAIFMQHNILNKWVLVCDELTLQLGAEFGMRVAMELAGIDELQDSRDAVVERGAKMMSLKAMTINEFRKSMGWEPVAWGDEPQAPLQQMSAVPLEPGDTQTPVDQSGPGDTPVPEPSKAPAKNGNSGNSQAHLEVLAAVLEDDRRHEADLMDVLKQGQETMKAAIGRPVNVTLTTSPDERPKKIRRESKFTTDGEGRIIGKTETEITEDESA